MLRSTAFTRLRPFHRLPLSRYLSSPSGASCIELDESKQKLSSLTGAPNSKVLAYFTASWCGPCKAISPYFNEFCKEHSSSIQFVKVDVDKNSQTAEEVRAGAPPPIIPFAAQGTP